MYIIENKTEIWYHGSPQPIKRWTVSLTGKGTDQDGAGIYFTTDEEDAEIYGKVQKVKLNFKKQLSNKIKPKKAELIKLIKLAPDYKETLTDFAEDPNEALSEAIENYLDYSSTHLEAVQAIEGDFYRRNGEAFCKAMTKLGYDGFIVDIKYNNILHAVVWNPDIIENI